ncbi:MAG: Lar family restriction alleviation protein [Clostridiales bacterium]|nr:Lar family restriction alleviation protein [Candidatus Crickella caballi]
MTEQEILNALDIQDCPICDGPATLEEENGWCYYVTCWDCGCHTAEVRFRSDDERLEAARKAVHLWNIGKVLSHEPGE